MKVKLFLTKSLSSPKSFQREEKLSINEKFYASTCSFTDTDLNSLLLVYFSGENLTIFYRGKLQPLISYQRSKIFFHTFPFAVECWWWWLDMNFIFRLLLIVILWFVIHVLSVDVENFDVTFFSYSGGRSSRVDKKTRRRWQENYGKNFHIVTIPEDECVSSVTTDVSFFQVIIFNGTIGSGQKFSFCSLISHSKHNFLSNPLSAFVLPRSRQSTFNIQK